ncbi:MAG TPA: porin family protein [Candidatus Binatia bacterium]|jgi:opacity protein-like surface antigen
MFSRSHGYLATALAGALVATTSVAALAADEASPYGGKSAYVSAGGVYAIENSDSNITQGSLDNSGGYDLRLGYGFNDWAAAEVEWQAMTHFDTNSHDPATGIENNPSPEARLLSLNGRYSPLTGRFQPYGLIGGGWYNVQADTQRNSLHESSFAMKFGIGLAAYITNRAGVAVEAAYILPLSGTLAGGHSFDVIPLTFSFFFHFK